MGLKDQKLLSQIRRGDIAAFESLFHSHYDTLVRYAKSLVREEKLAEEVIQEVFYNIWKNRESLRINRSWQAYLHRSVFNNSMWLLRKTRKEFLTREGTMPDRGGSEGDPGRELEFKELSEWRTRTLMQLPDRTRDIFLMNRQEGKRYREIAEELSISVKTVEAHMGKALEAFRKSLQKYEG